MYQLREPQQIVYSKIREHVVNKKKKILVSAPTGFGKTILSYQICKDALSKNNRVLFTSHRISLAEQSRDKFIDLKPSFLQGNSSGFNEDYSLLVATLQTLINTEIKEPRIVIIDEVHYAYESGLVQSLFTRFPNAIFIGLSATPTDDKNFLLDGFEAIINDYQTPDLIKLGWLVPFRVFSPMKINTSNVKISKTTNDYQEKSLQEEVIKEDINFSIVNNYSKLGENRKFICFALNKIHCLALQSAFLDSEILTEIISADTSKKERLLIIERYKKGLTKGLISVEILTAGFDDPTVKCVILASPTKAWKKFIQCCGRGIRLLGNTIEESISNGKSDCILLDCAGLIEEHGMPDDRKELVFGKKISRVIDREFNLDISNENRQNLSKVITEEKQLFLKQIGSLLDIYEGKVYNKESDLQNDVNNFLDKTNYFYWRQNSGKMFKDGRWIHFSSKSGLPDNSAFYKNSSLFFGLELKLKYGKLTEHQKQTLPEMKIKGVLFFICESVYDVYKSIEHIENNTETKEDSFIIYKSIYNFPDWQINIQNKLKL
jgi:superfamily II DNA or RNA helicase